MIGELRGKQKVNETISHSVEVLSGAAHLDMAAPHKTNTVRNDAPQALVTAARSVRIYRLDPARLIARNRDVERMRLNLRQVIRHHRTRFVIIAAAIGFLAGYIMRRKAESVDQEVTVK